MSGPGLVHLVAICAAVLGPVLLLVAWPHLRSSRGRSAFAGLYLLLYGLGAWSFLIEPKLLVVRHLAIDSPDWRGPPLRMALISDTHVAAPHTDRERVRRLVARVEQERPDLVLLLGDHAGRDEPEAARDPHLRSAILGAASALASTDAPLGVVAVLGNHDWWFDAPAIEAALASGGAEVLENRAIRRSRPGGAFWLAGVADRHSLRARPSVSRALANVPAGEPVIVLTHWPDYFAAVPEGVALTVAGHSHCGQVNLPLIGRPILPSEGSRRWPCGAYVVAGRRLYVTGGVGVSILPVRFRATPEVVILTLRAASRPGDRMESSGRPRPVSTP